jgi:serine/threonine-protein kinase
MTVRGRRLSEVSLRRLDLAGFLVMGLLLSYWQFRLLTVAPAGGFDSPGFESAWQFYAITYTLLMWVVVLTAEGLFIPQSPRRCAALMAAAIATSAAVSVAAAWVSPAAARVVPGLLLEVIFTLSGTAVFCISAAVRVRALERTANSAVGSYTLREKLGAGGMGEVWLAEHRLLKRPCAVKLVRAERAGDPAVLRRFEREVQATSRLRHPNIVEIYDYGLDDDGAFFYVMEHLPGLSLDRLVNRHGPLPAPRAIHLLRQLCAALREAHAAGLVHRDLKPGNVVVCDRGPPDCIKLLDFGLVRSVGESDAFSTLTGEGHWSGTPAYMAPEQIGKGVVDGRTDLYALGAVAYFMLTGRELFPRDNVLLTLTAHLRELPEPPSALRPELPADLETVVLRCLSKAPTDRYGSAAELDRALAHCTDSTGWTEDEAASWWREPGMTWSGTGVRNG